MALDDYRPDYPGMAAWLRSRDAYGVVRDAAERGAAYAAAVAPRRTGRYAAGIEVEAALGWDSRVAADIVGEVEYSAEVERDHHTLRAAAQMIEAG